MIERILDWLYTDIPAMELWASRLSWIGGALAFGALLVVAVARLMAVAAGLAPSAPTVANWVVDVGGAVFGLGVAGVVGAFMLRAHIRTVKNAMP